MERVEDAQVNLDGSNLRMNASEIEQRVDRRVYAYLAEQIEVLEVCYKNIGSAHRADGV